MEYLTPSELAARYHGAISVRTLANWRSKGEGPAFTKIGGKVLYARAAVLEWEGTRVRAVARMAAAAGLLTFGMLARAVYALPLV